VLNRLSKIAGARLMGTEPTEEPPAIVEPKTIVAAAQAFAERARARVKGLAA